MFADPSDRFVLLGYLLVQIFAVSVLAKNARAFSVGKVVPF